jgi:hypothetical protein
VETAVRPALQSLFTAIFVAISGVPVAGLAQRMSEAQRVDGEREANAQAMAVAMPSPVPAPVQPQQVQMPPISPQELQLLVPFIRNCGPIRTPQQGQARRQVTLRLLSLPPRILEIMALAIGDGQCGLDQNWGIDQVPG